MSRRRSTAERLGQMETETENLVWALREYGEDDLAVRLLECQKNRREKARRQRAGEPTGWPKSCRSVACPSCRQWHGSKWRKKAAAMFEGVENLECSHVTIMLAGMNSLDEMRDVIEKFRVDLRNWRDRHVAKSQRWAGIKMVGHIETDALLRDDVELLPPKRQTMIAEIQHIGDGPMLWLPHAHLSVHHPAGLDRAVLFDALRQQWPGAHRVDVTEFRDDNEDDASMNAGRVMGYSMKHNMQTTYSVTRESDDGREYQDVVYEPWRLSWKAAYWSWLVGMNDGFRPIRIRLGPKVLGTRDVVRVAHPVPIRFEPMPVVFGFS